MNSDKLIDILNTYPSTELLKLKNRNFIIRFLNDTFQEGRMRVADNVMIDRLTDYLEQYNNEAEDDDNTEKDDKLFETLDVKAKNLLRRWSDRGYLANYLDSESGQTMYELSSDSSKVIDWLIGLKKSEYVGTESKFDNIRTTLKDLVENSNQDKETRLKILEDRKTDIEKQIIAINNGEDIKVYEDYQIVERFDNLSKQSKELLSDFNQVDSNFLAIIKKLYADYSSKTKVLGDFFDAFYDLKNSPQGKSFYAFWEFMRSADMQEELDGLVSKLYSIMEERNIKPEDTFLKNMIEHLYLSGKKVSESNDKLAQKLTRILSESEKRNAIKELLSSIKKSVIALSDAGVVPDISFEIETGININLPTERRLTLTPSTETVYNTDIKQFEADVDDFGNLHKIFKSTIDNEKIKQRINEVLLVKKQATIAQIVDYCGGITQGLAEVIAYISASKYYKSIINENVKEIVMFDNTNNKIIEIPEIILSR